MTAVSHQLRNSDPQLLASLAVWEGLFGTRPLSWGELRDMGLKLTPAEATEFLSDQLKDPEKEGLCGELLRRHPELAAFLRRGGAIRVKKRSQRGEHHFIAKIVAGGGPEPKKELAHICRQAKDSPDGLAWFATRKPGVAWQPLQGRSMRSSCLIFTRNPDGNLDAVAAEVRHRQNKKPEVPSVDQLYHEHEGFQGWWQLANPQKVQLESLAAIRGTSTSKLSAAECFKGMATFAYWRLPPAPQTVVAGFLPNLPDNAAIP